VSNPGAVATHVHGNFVAVSSGRPKVRYFTAEAHCTAGKINMNLQGELAG